MYSSLPASFSSLCAALSVNVAESWLSHIDLVLNVTFCLYIPNLSTCVGLVVFAFYLVYVLCKCPPFYGDTSWYCMTLYFMSLCIKFQLDLKSLTLAPALSEGPRPSGGHTCGLINKKIQHRGWRPWVSGTACYMRLIIIALTGWGKVRRKYETPNDSSPVL